MITSIPLVPPPSPDSCDKAWHPPPSHPVAKVPSGQAEGQGWLYSTPSHSSHLAGDKPITRKISNAIVHLVVIDHLLQRLEGGDVEVGGRVDDVHLDEK